ncbi:MAG: hypothetical protein GF333_07820 [Candidatus Omnitrophica bacterium]|nr:hypothetical protein [Candidatus Omnitrophota bacterium]
MNRILAACTFFLCCCLFPFGAVPLSITARPPSFDLYCAPRSVRTFVLEVNNTNENRELELKLSVESLSFDPDGNINFRTLEKDPEGVASWIQLPVTRVKLAPQEDREIPLRLRVPPKIPTGGYYAAVIVEPAQDTAAPRTGLNVSVRLASIVRITVRGQDPLRKDARVASVEQITGPVDPEELTEAEVQGIRGKVAEAFPNTNGLFFIAKVENTGNIHVETEGSILVRTGERRRAGMAKFAAERGIVYPGSSRLFVAHFPYFLAEGDYIAEVRLGYGGARPLIQKFPFTIRVARDGTDESGDIFSPLEIIPKEIELSAVPGAFRTQKVLVFNRLREDLALSVSARGALREWIQFVQPVVPIKEAQEKNIIFRVRVPRSAEPGDYAGMLVLEDAAAGIREEIPAVITLHSRTR